MQRVRRENARLREANDTKMQGTVEQSQNGREKEYRNHRQQQNGTPHQGRNTVLKANYCISFELHSTVYVAVVPFLY